MKTISAPVRRGPTSSGLVLLCVASVLSSAVHSPALGQGRLPPGDTLASPLGLYSVSFSPVAHRRFNDKESLSRLDNVDHVAYTLAFVRVADGATVAEFPYVDVYGFEPSEGPTPPDVIASWLDWSPEEDFVIVPSEGWASAPGTPERPVIALNPALGWSQSALAMDTLIWADRLVVVGGQHRDCYYAADVFDGSTGLLRPLDGPPESPVGYEIVATGDRTVVVRRILDNCAMERDSWVPECRAVSLDTFEARDVPCPAGGEVPAPAAAAASVVEPFEAWVPLFDQDLSDWLSNEFRATELCDNRTTEFAECYQRMMEPLVRVLPVHREPSVSAPRAGEIILVSVPGRGLTAHVRIGDGNDPALWTPDLYDPDWGYTLYVHQTFLAREDAWFLLPAGPFDEPVWVLLESGDGPPEVVSVREGDILDFEGGGWVVVGTTTESLTLRAEQDADMWCQPEDPPPLAPSSTRTLTRPELSDERGHLMIRPKYTRGC